MTEIQFSDSLYVLHGANLVFRSAKIGAKPGSLNVAGQPRTGRDAAGGRGRATVFDLGVSERVRREEHLVWDTRGATGACRGAVPSKTRVAEQHGECAVVRCIEGVELRASAGTHRDRLDPLAFLSAPAPSASKTHC